MNLLCKTDIFLDSLINNLLHRHERSRGRRGTLTESDILILCRTVKEIFRKESTMLKLRAPINVCGDIHGQYTDLLSLFRHGGFPPTRNYLFLGDYVDRGQHSLEVISLLFAFKCKYNKNFFMIRGNHEDPKINKQYGFHAEIVNLYGQPVWEAFNDCFSYMPIAAVINGKIYCCHGGLGPETKSLERIDSIERPVNVPLKGLLCDTLWADPTERFNGCRKNRDRQISYKFGPNVVKKFLKDNGLQLLVRAHQVKDNGFSYSKSGQLLTVFSAPRYERGNRAAVLVLDENLARSFIIFE